MVGLVDARGRVGYGSFMGAFFIASLGLAGVEGGVGSCWSWAEGGLTACCLGDAAMLRETDARSRGGGVWKNGGAAGYLGTSVPYVVDLQHP